MSHPEDPRTTPGPVYGQEGAYAPHDAAHRDVPVPPPAGTPTPPPAGATPPVGYPSAGDGPSGDTPAGYGSSSYPPPGYPPPGYPRPGGSYPRNDLAVWSLVLGLLGVLGCLFFTGIPAVIVGGNARKAVAQGQADNEGMATAGIVLGWVATGLGALVTVFSLVVLVPLMLLGMTVPFLTSTP